MNDVVIWNEPNSNDFWQPQFRGSASAAPAAYGALLATCWDMLHGLRPGVNLLSSTSSRGNDDAFAVSNAGHSPGAFVRRVGTWYRASGRTRPLFDTAGHHPYPANAAERPSARHTGSKTIGQGDLGAFFNFLLVDEPSLSAWQSGLFWADGYPKPAYDAFRAAIADVRAGAVRCA